MTSGWLNPAKYEIIRNTAATGPGTMYEGYSWKWVNHSTEGPPGSIAGTIALFKAQPASCPHFMIDPMGTQRRVQFIPWTWSACALRGGAGGYQTNRGRAVQVEICGYAKDSGSWPDDALWIVADTIADVIKDGCPINPENMPDDSGLRGTLATMNAPQRMNWGTWQAFDGVTAHVRVPNNDHWDCGAINSRRLKELILKILGGGSQMVVPGAPGGALPAAPASPQWGFLASGMTGGQITLLQELLIALGYDVGGADGVFGRRTENAVRQFQSDQGIEVDGVVGPETKARLSAAAPRSDAPPLPAPPHPAQGFPAWPGRFFVLTNPMMQGGDIRTWQSQMHNRGWAIDVDGIYGPNSERAAEAFQAEFGLTIDGVVGQQTWSATWTTPVT